MNCSELVLWDILGCLKVKAMIQCNVPVANPDLEHQRLHFRHPLQWLECLQIVTAWVFGFTLEASIKIQNWHRLTALPTKLVYSFWEIPRMPHFFETFYILQENKYFMTNVLSSSNRVFKSSKSTFYPIALKEKTWNFAYWDPVYGTLQTIKLKSQSFLDFWIHVWLHKIHCEYVN